MLIGGHVEPDDPLGTAVAEGADCVQIFLGDPQGWKKPPPREDADALKAADTTIYVHAPYIVNVASPNNRIRIPSRKILQQTVDAAAEIDAAAVIVHGGHVTKDEAADEGFLRWAKAMDQLDMKVPVLLENTAGGDHAMARHFDTIAGLWDHIGDSGIGFCLDTCHAHAAGEELISSAERILSITGRIDLVHCNDSKDGHGSGRDRHEHLGQGECEPEALLETVRVAKAPVICETGEDGRKDDIAWLRDQL
jgi:deoxyribonuclease IV